MEKVSIIGSGNVATNLGKALTEVGVKVTHVVSKTEQNAKAMADAIGSTVAELHALPKNQLTLVCIPDDAIHEILTELDTSIPIAYTSGSVGIDELPERKRIGVFYPLQTFSKKMITHMRDVPFLVESKNATFQGELSQLAMLLSDKVQIVNSEQRRKIHLAAVWINNFTNHIVHQAQEITREQQLEYDLLLPLLKETLRKLDFQTAYEAQTGPARRGDLKTIDKHVAAQEGLRKDLYILLSKSIQKTYGNEEL